MWDRLQRTDYQQFANEIDNQHIHIRIHNQNFYYNDECILLEYDKLKEQIDGMQYPKLLGQWSEDAKVFNQLEADRPQLNQLGDNTVWNIQAFNVRNNRIAITLPSFNIIFWHLFYKLKRVPLFEEYTKAYLATYLRQSKIYIDNGWLFRNGQSHGHVNNEVLQLNDGSVFYNKLLYFRDGVNCNLPINQITTEQILRRLIKIYGSFIRDLYHPVIFYHCGAEVLYDSMYDITGGIDMIVNKYVCCSYVNSKKSVNFATDKQQFRHNENVLIDDWGEVCGFKLITKLDQVDDNTLLIPNEDVIRTIITDCERGQIKETYYY